MLAELRELRRVLQHGWCREALAQNAEGVEVEVDSVEAVRFCVLGGIHRVVGRQWAQLRRHTDLRAALEAEAELVYGPDLASEYLLAGMRRVELPLLVQLNDHPHYGLPVILYLIDRVEARLLREAQQRRARTRRYPVLKDAPTREAVLV